MAKKGGVVEGVVCLEQRRSTNSFVLVLQLDSPSGACANQTKCTKSMHVIA